MPPFQGLKHMSEHLTQGCALGYHIVPSQGSAVTSCPFRALVRDTFSMATVCIILECIGQISRLPEILAGTLRRRYYQ
jgi:hypothetical protein